MDVFLQMGVMAEEQVSGMNFDKDDLVSKGQKKEVFSGFYRIMDGF